MEPLSALVGKGFVELLTKLATDHAERLLDPSPARVAKIKTNLTPHIESTFNRCNTIKTLLNPSSPANFLSIYATQRFHCNGSAFDQYSLVDYIRSEQNNVILTGTGGAGKSIFTRYLWISLFVYCDGKIPLYIELRNLNTISKIDLKSYIFHNISQGKGSISEKDFNSNLGRGDFVFILDGFDEVSYDRREEVQAAIMAIAENYPSTKLVVTSRPDGRFTSWTTFHVVETAPLLKADVVELIEKAEFDDQLKARFAKKIQFEGLFEKHHSFLSNPLLASMMLLTFSHNQNIPDKMHLFYEQAFDALYQRHDSHKPGGFRREFKTALSEDNFKAILSYFCLVSYYEEAFKFTREEALECLRKASALSLIEVDSSDLLDDLCDSVCVLVREGLEYTFSHRSFQEYFTAYCLSYVTTKHFRKFVFRFANRADDGVIPLLAEMASESFRELFVLPGAENFAGILQLGTEKKSVEKFYAGLGKYFEFRKYKHGRRFEYTIVFFGDSDAYNYVNALEKLLYRREPERRAGGVASNRDRDNLAVRQLFNWLKLKEAARLKITASDGRFRYHYYSEGNRPRPGGFDEKRSSKPLESEALDEIFRRSFMHEYLARKVRNAEVYISDARKIESDSADVMKDLFGR